MNTPLSPRSADTRRAGRARLSRALLAGSALALVAACGEPLDFDLRGRLGAGLNTSEAALQASAARPRPDDRGIISYPNYQVAVARRGDTLGAVANRVGTDAQALAKYNGMKINDPLREGEVIALPTRVAEPSAATGARVAGPITPQTDITALAGGAIDRARSQGVTTTPLAPAPAPGADSAATAPDSSLPSGAEPTRHKVTRGETAFTIARLYGVSVRALAEWNGLGGDFAIREGQYLLIPVPAPGAAPAAATTSTEAPGIGTPTPTPPSAKTPLPDETTVAPAAAKATAAATPSPAPDLGASQTAASSARMSYPVKGQIIREYVKGKTDGIDISAPAGSAIGAADAGTVAAITSDADEVPIIVVKHPNNLLTVYANVGDIAVKKGDTVARGQRIAKIRGGNSNYVHFEVRKGFDSVDPVPYLQ